jgi:hypothetical protein
MSGTDLAKASLVAAALNSLVAIVLLLLTFVSNAFILRYVSRCLSCQKLFYVANIFQIQPFHKGLAKLAFCLMPGA